MENIAPIISYQLSAISVQPEGQIQKIIARTRGKLGEASGVRRVSAAPAGRLNDHPVPPCSGISLAPEAIIQAASGKP